MSLPAASSYPLDHLVLPTADLGVARTRLGRLGFTVAPDGVHPFGTANCCVYLPDGTFLEPLAAVDRGAVDQAAGSGNVFVAHDQSFRVRNGQEGCSALVIGSTDAQTDHRRFEELGLSAGDGLAFSRSFSDASGVSDTVSFRLAFAKGSAAPDLLVFSCERVNAPKIDRSALETHANGVVQLKRVLVVGPDPAGAARLAAALCGCEEMDDAIIDGEMAWRIALANTRLECMDAAAFERRFGALVGPVDGPRIAGLGFGVESVMDVISVLQATGIAFDSHGGMIVVPPTPGQGVTFVFEEL